MHFLLILISNILVNDYFLSKIAFDHDVQSNYSSRLIHPSKDPDFIPNIITTKDYLTLVSPMDSFDVNTRDNARTSTRLLSAKDPRGQFTRPIF